MGTDVGRRKSGRTAEDEGKRRPSVGRTAATLRVPETRAEQQRAATPPRRGRNTDSKRTNSFFIWQLDRGLCRSFL